MIFSMKSLIYYVCLSAIVCAVVACSGNSGTSSNGTIDSNRINTTEFDGEKDSIIDSSLIYDLWQPLEGDSSDISYMFYALPIIEPDSIGRPSVFYCRSIRGESNVTYRRKFYKGTRYEKSNPEVAQVLDDAMDGNREAALILSALSNDAYKQLSELVTYEVLAYDPYSDSVILSFEHPENKDASIYYFEKYSKVLADFPLVAVMVDGFMRSCSNDGCNMLMPPDCLYDEVFHRMYQKRSKEIRKLMDDYKAAQGKGHTK